MHFPLRHLCLVHQGEPSVHLDAIVPFLSKGLCQRGRSIFLGSPEMVQAIITRLTEEAIPVPLKVREGALILISDQEHLNEGRFDPLLHLAKFETLYEETLKEGYSGLWGSGDIGWEFGPESNLAMLYRYETAVEKMIERLPHFHALCQYRKDALPIPSVASGLLSHRGVVINSSLPRWNPFFARPDIDIPYPVTDAHVERMLALLTKP